MSKIEVDAIEPQSGTTLTIGASGDTVNFATGATLGSGIGKVLQVVTATDSTQRSTTSTSFVTASNTLSVSITPSSASNKVLILVSSTILVLIMMVYLLFLEIQQIFLLMDLLLIITVELVLMVLWV
jgi:hypothetical protein